MRPSPVFPSWLLTLGGTALLAVCVGVSACHRPEEPPSTGPSPSPGPAVSAPFDVQDVMRRAERSFHPKPSGAFRGDQDTYALEVDADGTVRMAPRQFPVESRGPDRSGAPRSSRKEVTQPVTAAPLTLRTLSVARGEAALARGLELSVRKEGALALGRGPVVEVLENGDAGMEQRWELAVEPEGAGDLEVRVAVAGQAYAGRTEHGHHFVDRKTGLGLRYGRATWVDAAGRRTDVETTWEQGTLVMRVPEGVLEGSAWPAVLDPVVSPEIDLDVPLPVPNRVENTRQKVAFGGGVYLVAWTHRTTAAQDDVLYARVRASDGVLLDVGSLAAVTGTGDQNEVAVASNGRDFLLAWEDHQVDSTTGPYVNIRGARVRGSDGRVLDSLSISAASRDQLWPAIASDGTDYFVVWYDFRNGSIPDIYGTRVRASDGAVLDAGGMAIATSSAYEAYPQVSFGGGNYLVTFNAGSLNGTRVRASDMAVLDGNRFVISHASGVSTGHAAFDGSQFLVVWSDQRNGFNNPDVYCARVGTDGSVLDPAGIPIVVEAGRQEGPSVATNGDGFLVAWQHSTARNVSDLHGAPVGRDGVVGPVRPLGLAASATDQEQLPSVASDGSRYFVAWYEHRSTGQVLVSGTRADPDGTLLDPEQVLSVDVSRELTPAVAQAGGTYLVVWKDEGAQSNGSDILGARVRASDGVVLDNPALRIATTSRLEEQPSVATDGSQFLVVFESRDANVSGSSDILGVRIRVADGAVLDGTPLSISTATLDQQKPTVAFGEGYYLVTWANSRPITSTRDLYGARVRASDGTVMAPGGVALGTVTLSEKPVIAYGGGHFLLVWQDGRSPTAPDISAMRVRASDGAVREPSGIPVAMENWEQAAPAVAFDGSHFLVAWHDHRYGYARGMIHGRRVRASDGVVVESDPIAFATELSFDQKQAALAFDGTRYLLAWNRSGNLMGRRFTPSMTPVDSTPFPISQNVDVWTSRIVAASSGPGRFLVAYNDFRLYPRIRARLVSDPFPNGERCTSGAQCASGFCADGVCCDGACGGGADTDCQACSVAAGGTADGTCGAVRAEVAKVCRPAGGACDVAEACDGAGLECPADGFVAAGEECRPAAHACDAAEVCGGQAGECPEDALAPDGTVCDDGNACTQSDTCQSGACAGAEPLVCTAPNPCMRPGVCDPVTGVCSAPQPVADGTACDDGNACTQSDSCQAGACTGANPVVCTVGDACHVAGTCNPATGACSEPTPAQNGTACDDGNACTRSDSCQSGTCTGADPVVCTASDTCHLEGTCNPATGVCSDPVREDGAVCSGGACQSGECVPTPDAGMGDADAGTEPDAGTETPDSGTATPDSGTEPDAGAETPDAGAQTPDSGTEPDGGEQPDAGAETPDAGDGTDAGTRPPVSVPVTETLGCGCGVPTGPSNMGLLMLIAGAALLRRSRRQRP